MRLYNAFFRTTAFALITLVMTGLSWAVPKETCHKINAKGIGTTVSVSPGGVTTVVDIIGGGLLNGSTRANFTFTGAAGTDVFFTGTLVLTTKHGTLTYEVSSGTFNVVTLEFSADLKVVSGTGRFAGATGTLHLEGVNNPDGTFTEDITGLLCLPK